MNIGLIGYGRMGKELENIARERGHEISLVIDINNVADLTVENLRKCDVIIEFTVPSSAVSNYLACFEAGVPVVSGTTGWLKSRDLVHEACTRSGGTFFYSSNFSVGVNLFFELNKKLAGMMVSQPGYHPGIKEVHHTRKLDSPSGTAIALAEDLVGLSPVLKRWTSGKGETPDELAIISDRIGDVPGNHTVTWESEDDSIEITHSARSRRGFAFGAVLAAEYCLDHKGILNMRDMLKF